MWQDLHHPAQLVAPYGHYSLHCRHQAWEAICANSDWERAALHCRDPIRSPDPTTLRRWAWRRLLNLGQSLKVWLWVLDWHEFLQAPTILAWDWMADGRILATRDLPGWFLILSLYVDGMTVNARTTYIGPHPPHWWYAKMARESDPGPSAPSRTLVQTVLRANVGT